MRLIHYSDKYITEVRSASQERDEHGRGNRGDKPHGLWVSVEGEDDWMAWCKGEDFRLHMLTHPTEVVLRDTANVLRIQGGDALQAFHHEYGCRPHYAAHLPGLR